MDIIVFIAMDAGITDFTGDVFFNDGKEVTLIRDGKDLGSYRFYNGKYVCQKHREIVPQPKSSSHPMRFDKESQVRKYMRDTPLGYRC